MAKHRKTRQEKKVADHRHILYHLEAKPTQERSIIEKNQPTISNPEFKISPIRTKTIASYAYVLNDIRKALLISSAIIIAQLVLYFYINRI